MAQSSPNRRRRFTDRWLAFCDRAAGRLMGEQNLPDVHGARLLCLAWLSWLSATLVPSWLRNTLRPKPRPVDVETRGLARLLEFWEYLVANGFDHLHIWAGRCYRLVVPEKLIQTAERAVVETSADTFEQVSSRGSALVRSIVPGRLRGWLERYVSPAADCYNFSMAWAKSRSWRKVLGAVPVAVLVLPMLATIAASVVYSDAQKQQHYQQALAAAVESRDASAEAILLQKLAQLGYRRLEHAEFHAAWELAQQDGKWDEAVTRMRALAPLDDEGSPAESNSPGYADAHVWLAYHLSIDAIDAIDATDRWDRVERHAQKAIQLATSRNRNTVNQARMLLTEVMDRRGDRQGATRELQALASQVPDAHFRLMQRSLAINHRTQAAGHAGKVIAYCESHDGESPLNPDRSLSSWHFRGWVSATELLEGADAARNVARQGIVQFPEDPFLRSWLANDLANHFMSANLTAEETVDTMREILRLDPQNATLQTRLASTAYTDGSAAKQIATKLTQTRSLPVTACLAMGDQRWNRHDARGALWFYQTASQVDPQSVAAWNNVAWMCGCVEETLDLDVAMVAVNKAIAIEPDPQCFETRGQIYARQERWTEAIQDLERAVNGSLPDNTPAHETLAKAFQALGDHEAAAAHRQRARLAD